METCGDVWTVGTIIGGWIGVFDFILAKKNQLLIYIYVINDYHLCARFIVPELVGKACPIFSGVVCRSERSAKIPRPMGESGSVPTATSPRRYRSAHGTQMARTSPWP